jgi:hypothetical protein
MLMFQSKFPKWVNKGELETFVGAKKTKSGFGQP